MKENIQVYIFYGQIHIFTIILHKGYNHDIFIKYTIKP